MVYIETNYEIGIIEISVSTDFELNTLLFYQYFSPTQQFN